MSFSYFNNPYHNNNNSTTNIKCGFNNCICGRCYGRFKKDLNDARYNRKLFNGKKHLVRYAGFKNVYNNNKKPKLCFLPQLENMNLNENIILDNVNGLKKTKLKNIENLIQSCFYHESTACLDYLIEYLNSYKHFIYYIIKQSPLKHSILIPYGILLYILSISSYTVSQFYLPNWIYKPKHQTRLLKFIQLKNISLVNCYRIKYSELINDSNKTPSAYYYKPLLSSSNSVEINRILFEKSGGSDINNVLLRKNQVIIDAIKNKNINLVKLLVKNGMDLNDEKLYENNSLPIHIAMKTNHKEIMTVLLDAGIQLRNCLPTKFILEYLNANSRNKQYVDDDDEMDEDCV